MLKIALLSAWHVHTRWFVKGLEDSGEGHICVVWDDDVERGQKMADDLGVPFVADLDQVLAMEDIEAVMVECATTKHTEIILKAAAAKKHIFCDKALALKSADTKKIREAVEANGVKFMLSLESKIIGCYNYATDMVAIRMRHKYCIQPSDAFLLQVRNQNIFRHAAFTAASAVK